MGTMVRHLWDKGALKRVPKSSVQDQEFMGLLYFRVLGLHMATVQWSLKIWNLFLGARRHHQE